MRQLQDPVLRSQMLQLYRLGSSHKEVAHAVGVTQATLKKERELDEDFERQVQHSMAHAFTPVLQHAVDLATQADAEGENEGALKALDMVMKFYTKNLDREHATEQLDRKIEAESRQLEGRARMPMLTNPEAVVAFMQELQAGPIIDAESWEE